MSQSSSSASKSSFRLNSSARLDLAPGEKPAARVVRRSSRRDIVHSGTSSDGSGISNLRTKQVITSSKEALSTNRSKGATASNNTKKTSPKPLVLGSIIERPRNQSFSTVLSSQRSSTSKFAKQRRNIQAINRGTINGFPTVHDKPMGTFVKTRNSNNFSDVYAKTASLRPGESPRRNTQGQQGSSTKSKADPLSTLEKVSERDADSMLAQMTPSEIEESIAELKSSLSPETIAFLKNRRRRDPERKETPLAFTASRHAGEAQQARSSPNDTNDVVVDEDKEENVAIQVNQEEQTDERAEKERLASIMSSIQSEADLDAAYATEAAGTLPPSMISLDNWHQTCDLLRSTAPKQVVWASRIICFRLEEDVKTGVINGRIPSLKWDVHPITLPVSLRCLLDTPLSKGSQGMLLRTYALRSIYALLQLRVPTVHNVSISNTMSSNDSSMSIYQEWFMDDAIPTPPFGSVYPSIAAKPLFKGSPAAYATSSSSASAKKDGEAFLRDPSWTLISNMKIIPRLAELLSDLSLLPMEGLVAICGILCMLSVRSPGAAAAIANHKTLMKLLLQRTLFPTDDVADNDGLEENEMDHYPNAALMLPALKLLSHMVRQSRMVAQRLDLNPIVLSVMGLSDEGVDLNVKRHCLILWRTMLRYGMGLEMVTAMISLSIPHLAKANHELGKGGGGLAAEFITSFANILEAVKILHVKTHAGRSIPSSVLNMDDHAILVKTKDWLFPTVQQSSRVLHESLAMDSSIVPLLDERIRLIAGCVRLLSTYLSTWVEDDTAGDSQRSFHASIQDLNVLALVDSLIDNATLMEEALSTTFQKSSETSLKSMAVQASLVVSAFDLGVILCRIGTSESDRLLQGLLNFVHRVEPNVRREYLYCDDAAFGWYRAAFYSLCRFMIRFAKSDTLTRPIVFGFIGRCQIGDEARAAILFSEDALFRQSNTPTDNEENQSALSSLFIKELCTSKLSRKQLDHSFKLHGGVGWNQNSNGCFSLDSLLSECDILGPKASEQLLLPLGNAWLHQVLAGRSQLWTNDRNPPLDENGSSSDEAKTSIELCLRLLINLERGHNRSDWYYERTGVKLYFLTNLCLQHETLLQNDTIIQLASDLRDLYIAQVSSLWAREFLGACVAHSNSASSSSRPPAEYSGEGKDELLEQVVGIQSDATKRASDSFVADLCDAFLTYGAQYDFCITCVRLLVRPQFPAAVRFNVWRRLQSVLSTLTLELEKGEEPMIHLLTQFLDNKNSGTSSELLNVMSDSLKSNPNMRVSHECNLVFLLAVVELAVRLPANEHLDDLPRIWKERLIGMPTRTVKVILKVAEDYQNSTGRNDFRGSSLCAIHQTIHQAQNGDADDEDSSFLN